MSCGYHFLNTEELELLDYVEQFHPANLDNFTEQLQNMQLSIQQKQGKNKVVNIRILESELEKIKM